MANIHDCLDRAATDGLVEPGRAAAAKAEYDQLVDRFVAGGMGLPQAEAEAAGILREVTKAATVARRHAMIHQLQAQVRLRGIILHASDPAKALKSLLEYDDGSFAAGFTGETVRSLRDAIEKGFMGQIADVLRATGTDAFGRNRDPATLRNVIRELHGQASGDAKAAQLAQAMRTVQERGRLLFNAHGGNIGKLADYGLTHTHDARAIRKAGFDGWAAETFDRLAWHRITDHQTGKAFTTAPGGRPNRAAGMAFLRRVYDEISSDGWVNRTPSTVTAGKALYNQRAEHRVLHFKDGDAWMDYNAKFGATDPFSAMLGGLRGLAQDIALMRVLGPNPRAGLEFASQIAKQRAAMMPGENMRNSVGKAAGTARLMLAHLDGSANTPAEGGRAWASFWSGTRGILTGVQLGSAFLSSMTDNVTVRMGAKVAGLNGNNITARAMALMGSEHARVQAANAGYIMDSLADMSTAAARNGLDEMMPDIARRISTFVMRASLLSRWTDAWRVAIQMEFASELGTNATRAFADLPEKLRHTLDRRGITPADWDHLRSAIYSPKPGTAFIHPQHWLQNQRALPPAEAEGLALRLQMVAEEMLEVMMPTFNLQARAKVIGDARPGTLRGEAARIALQYKNYPIAFTIGQFQRIRWGKVGSRVGYTAALIAGMTAMGALSVQMKEIAKGRDPRPMTDGKFWLAAMIQGGGAGIFGDFLYATESRAGGGLAETLAGPAVGLAADAIGLVGRNAMALAKGEDTALGRDVANFVRYNTPVGSSLWYVRVAFDRLIADPLQQILDPDAEEVFRRRIRQQQRDYNNDYWWSPGDASPTRGPDLSNAARPPG